MKPVKNATSATLLTAAHDAPRAGQIIGDRYRLEQPLERGAMGSVWRAEHVRLRAPVAVKFLDPALIGDQEMHDRFVQEARSAAAVRSAHVVQVIDYGSEAGLPYIAMELLHGENLDVRLGRGTLSSRELDKIFGEIARGIGKAHAMGVVHRDLKPGNIFIAREGDHEVTKLVDFGIAKVKADALKCTQNVGTHVGTLLGTPQYMSPEQVRGSALVDHRTDLWALAIIACECLTGRYPFSGTSIGDLTVQICTEKPMPPSSLGEVPPGFDQWFSKATRKKPSKRFANVEEMAAALHKLLALAPAPGEAKPWPQRLLGLHTQSDARRTHKPRRSNEARLTSEARRTSQAPWQARPVARLRAGWFASRKLLMRYGAELARGALEALAWAKSRQLGFARLAGTGPRVAAALGVLVIALGLVALSSRAFTSVQAASKAPAASAEEEAAATQAAALAGGSPSGAPQPEVEVEVWSALPSDALPSGALPSDTIPTPESSQPNASPPASSSHERQAPRERKATQAEPSAPASQPMTLAMAKAAAKIMTPKDPQAASSSDRTRTEAEPSATPAKRAPQSPPKKRHPFADRL